MTEECSNLHSWICRFLLHELWSSVIEYIHKTIIFLVIFWPLLFNVPLCPSFGDLVLFFTCCCFQSVQQEKSPIGFSRHCCIWYIFWQGSYDSYLINSCLVCGNLWFLAQSLVSRIWMRSCVTNHGDLCLRIASFCASLKAVLIVAAIILSRSSWHCKTGSIFVACFFIHTHFNHITQFYKRICKPGHS